VALPTLWRIDDRDSEIYCCGTISMHVLRFFLTRRSVATPGGAPARRCICVRTPGPLPHSRLFLRTPTSLSSTRFGLDRLFLCPLIQPLRPKLPFKSHSAPRPPQTPAASSLSPYRKRLGSAFFPTRNVLPESFPIKASDYTGVDGNKKLGGTDPTNHCCAVLNLYGCT
jgi:hypothetical protein